MPALDLALGRGLVRPAVNEAHGQACADALQRGAAVGRAVIDDQAARDASSEQGLLEHALDLERGLGQAERAMGNQARGIVHQRDEVGLAAFATDR